MDVCVVCSLPEFGRICRTGSGSVSMLRAGADLISVPLTLLCLEIISTLMRWTRGGFCTAEIHIPLGLISYQHATRLTSNRYHGCVEDCGVCPKTWGEFICSGGRSGGSRKPGAEPQCERRGDVQSSPGGFSGEKRHKAPKSCSWNGFAASLKQKRNLEKFRIQTDG